MNKMFYCVIILLFLSGCKQEVPEPEALTVEATELQKKDFSQAIIKHNVHGRNVLVECNVKDIHFANTASKNNGKVLLYVNNRLYNEYNTAAFVVKGLKSGTHKLKVELVDLNNKSYGVSKEFLVTII
nr:hypothetical protein [Paenibacillus bovis]